MSQRIDELDKYTYIKITSKLIPGVQYTGQYRGRIKDIDNYGFDSDGRAIWITTDHGFEMFERIDRIATLEILPLD
jgi:hypothetical protein